MRYTDEIVQKIEKCYTAEDYMQAMIPYESICTIISEDGILYYKGNGEYINKYLEDERKNSFLFNNIPEHLSKNEYRYTNQILEYNKPYLRIDEYSIIENYAIKDSGETYLFNKLLDYRHSEKKLTREQLDDLFDKSSYDGEVYFLYKTGELINEDKILMPTEEEIVTTYKQSMIDNLKNVKSVLKKTYRENQYNLLESSLLNYVDKSIENFNIDDMSLNYEIDEPIYIIKINNGKIDIDLITIEFVNYNNYNVSYYNVPIKQYDQSDITKTKKIYNTKSPDIPFKFINESTDEELPKSKSKIKKFFKK